MSSKISPFILDDVPNGQEAVGRRSELSSNRGRLLIPLEQELVIERELYETRTADDHQRGQVVMLKKVIDLLETGDK